ncbi:LysR family transcriptional regulator [Variovorax sp. OV329]|uniref:LysR family transcriptional regulator n=1 Tax=Variovorax sp. OV329 TaxID=1882825 RepID=UPI000B83CF49|nr:LysR family transcriptional regulator [Variovorax sp. OV329]
MEPGALTLLVDIIDAGNLSEAARRLKMTRANVSYHLGQLERAVGLQLVRRTTRRLEPTEAGLRLYQHGLGIQNELAAARESVTALGQTLQGRVRLNAPSGYGQVVLAPWLIEFKLRYPGIVLDVMFENRVEDLLSDEVDIAIRIMSEPPPHLVAREMGPVRYVACASRAFADQHAMPTQVEDLRSMPLLTSGVVSRQLRLSAYRDEQRQVLMLEPTLTSENFNFLRQAVLAGIGVGIVPDYVMADDVACGDAVTVLDDWRLSIFGDRMFMLYMPNRHHTRATATFIEHVLARARAAPA